MFRRVFKKFISDSDNLRTERTILALVLGFLIGLGFGLRNGLGLFSALESAIWFSLLVGVIVAVLAWAVDTATQKGYSGWVGFLAVVLLNVFGILLLLVLPSRK